MTDTEKLIITRLLLAIETARKPHHFKLGLPPRPGELDDRMAESDARRRQQESALAAAVNAARAVIA